MPIRVRNLQKKIPLNLHQIKRIATVILELQKAQRSDLSICFVSTQKIISLNKKFLNRNHSTDVLAFDLHDDKRVHMTGEVIICCEAAVKASKAYNTTVSQEMALYVTHGILHLLGYDDRRSGDAKKMRKREQEILEYLGNKVSKILKGSRGQGAGGRKQEKHVES